MFFVYYIIFLEYETKGSGLKMKNKGFTLVELLAVIAILAILVIVAMPNVLGMFNEAKANTFVTEVQKYIDAAKTAFVNDALSNQGKAVYYSSEYNDDLKTAKLDMDGSKEYFIEMDRHGDFKRIVIKDDSFCYDIYAGGTQIKFDDSKSKKISNINKNLVSVSDVWNSEDGDSITISQDGSNFKVKGCEAVTTIEGKSENVITNVVKIDDIEYKFIPGMTWGEWEGSEYNTISNLEIGTSRLWLPGDEVLRCLETFCSFGTGSASMDDIVEVTDEIIKNASYRFHDIGEIPRDLDCISGTSYYDSSEPIKYNMQKKVYTEN